MKFQDFPYERPNHIEAIATLETLLSKMETADSSTTFLTLFQEFEKTNASFWTLGTIASTRNTINTKDKFYDDERKYFDEVGPLFKEPQVALEKLLLNSPFRKELEEKLGSILFINAELNEKAFDPKIIPLMQEENRLASEYQKLYASAIVNFQGKEMPLPMLGPFKQSPDRAIRKEAFEVEGKFFDDNQEELDRLFDELVACRTKQARELGFDNFLELGYIRRERNCYGPEGVANYRSQVLNNLVPLVKKLKEAQAKRIDVQDFKFYDDTFGFNDGNATPKGSPEELLAAAKKMYSEMSEETKTFIEMMFDMDLFDVISRDGKAPGGYCTTIEDYHCPFIFSNFNGTAGDVDVLTHEAGHAFASYIADKEIPYSSLRQPSMEACEVHSMSMEILTTPWHELFFKEDTKKYQLTQALDALYFIPYGTMVDYFQELVYTKPDMTPEERNKTWLELESQFRPYIDFEDLPFYSRGAGWQRQLHIYLYPFYYIDYCMAQTVALQIFSLFLSDEKKAWETYMNFTKMGGTRTFIDLVKTAGLDSPLEDGCLASICNSVEQWIQSNN